jgi:hypothetical protein
LRLLPVALSDQLILSFRHVMVRDKGLAAFGYFGSTGGSVKCLLQQHLSENRSLASAIKVTQDRGFLLGQPDLLPLGANEQLRAWQERIGADGERGVLAGFVLAKLRTNASRSTVRRNGLAA